MISRRLFLLLVLLGVFAMGSLPIASARGLPPLFERVTPPTRLGAPPNVSPPLPPGRPDIGATLLNSGETPKAGPPQPLEPPPGGPPSSPGAPLPPPAPPEVPPAPPHMAVPELSNITRAITTATEVKAHLNIGAPWGLKGPAGDVQVKATLLYQGVAVGELMFDPVTGTPLPMGYPPMSATQQPDLQLIASNVPQILQGLQVLPGVTYRAPEEAWIVPLAFNGSIVAELRIYADGVHVIPIGGGGGPRLP